MERQIHIGAPFILLIIIVVILAGQAIENPSRQVRHYFREIAFLTASTMFAARRP